MKFRASSTAGTHCTTKPYLQPKKMMSGHSVPTHCTVYTAIPLFTFFLWTSLPDPPAFPPQVRSVLHLESPWPQSMSPALLSKLKLLQVKVISLPRLPLAICFFGGRGVLESPLLHKVFQISGKFSQPWEQHPSPDNIYFNPPLTPHSHCQS